MSVITPRFTTEVDKATFECEGCGAVVPRVPWPDGWYQCGRSRRRIGQRINVIASWCRACHHRMRKMVNPSAAEITAIRKQLNAPERDAETSAVGERS